jgi:hypothetical protein
MALIWIIDYSVISAIWTRIWHLSFRYEIPTYFFYKNGAKNNNRFVKSVDEHCLYVYPQYEVFKQFEYLNGYKHACFIETRVD